MPPGQTGPIANSFVSETPPGASFFELARIVEDTLALDDNELTIASLRATMRAYKIMGQWPQPVAYTVKHE